MIRALHRVWLCWLVASLERQYQDSRERFYTVLNQLDRDRRAMTVARNRLAELEQHRPNVYQLRHP